MIIIEYYLFLYIRVADMVCVKFTRGPTGLMRLEEDFIALSVELVVPAIAR